MAKSTKAEARYVDRAPGGRELCRMCTMYRAPGSCTAVMGKISAGGHCRFYEAKRKRSTLL